MIISIIIRIIVIIRGELTPGTWHGVLRRECKDGKSRGVHGNYEKEKESDKDHNFP